MFEILQVFLHDLLYARKLLQMIKEQFAIFENLKECF